MKAILLISSLLMPLLSLGQHHAQHEPVPDLQFTTVLSQVMSDPELKSYKMESMVLTIKPGGIDTVSHRHDCELFGYVLEGKVDVALITKVPQTFSTGQMFYEKRNVLHTLTRNGSQDKIARVLLIFIIKEGREGYKAEYSGH